MTRQMTLPCTLSGSMSYLQVLFSFKTIFGLLLSMLVISLAQVPGQETRSRPSPSACHDRRLRLPSGGIDEVAASAGGSPVLVRRRLGHQASVESYYSFASEGDGDIFASMDNVAGRQRLGRQTSFCIPDSNISEYSEFNEDFFSSISELFVGRQRGRLENQGTFSEQGSIRSLSIDQEEITFELPGMREEEEVVSSQPPPTTTSPHLLNVPSTDHDFVNPGQVPELPHDNPGGEFLRQPSDDFEGYMSSSCSISMSSDIESSHQITVPVFIEPAPPEERDEEEDDNGGNDGQAGSYWREDAANRLVHQETMHTDSGLDTEEICPASPYGGRYSADDMLLASSESPQCTKGSRHLEEEGALRMVLVRDIGIQCCAESPQLSTRGRKGSRASAGSSHTPPRTASGSPATGGATSSKDRQNFTTELLF